VEILHVTRRSDWDAARATGTYRWSTKGRTYEDVGFVHASTREQLPAVAAYVFADDRDELCVLHLDTDTITAAGTDVRFEDGGGGELYPHVYGPVDPAWVTDVEPAHVGPDGVFTWGPPR
jgi:uncharacterized protein (DUF952 family)